MGYHLEFAPNDGTAYVFGPTWYPADRSQSNVVPSAKLARAHGARQLTGYKAGRRLVIRGGLLGPTAPIGSVTNLRTEIDDLLAALNSGPGLLYFGEDDRVFRCVQWESFGEPYSETHFGRILAGSEIAFMSGDPYRYALTTTSDTWSAPASADTRTITNTGTADAEPSLSILVGGAGAVTIAFTVENTTTGESFTLSGDVTGGDTIVVECQRPKAVTISDVDKRTLFEGEFLRLQPGANVLTVTYTLGTISQVQTDYIARYH